jgi:hypothetical protein
MSSQLGVQAMSDKNPEPLALELITTCMNEAARELGTIGACAQLYRQFGRRFPRHDDPAPPRRRRYGTSSFDLRQ